MSFAKVINGLIEVLGKALSDSGYTLPEDQRVPEANPVDEFTDWVEDTRIRRREGIEDITLERHAE